MCVLKADAMGTAELCFLPGLRFFLSFCICAVVLQAHQPLTGAEWNGDPQFLHEACDRIIKPSGGKENRSVSFYDI